MKSLLASLTTGNLHAATPAGSPRTIIEQLLGRELAWVTSEALCRQVDNGDIWFPDRGEGSRLAREVCELCPLRAACLEYALQHPDVFGVWGGTSDKERQAIRRGLPYRRRQAKVTAPVGRPVSPCGTVAAYKRAIKAGVTPCEPCREANRDYIAGRRERARGEVA